MTPEELDRIEERVRAVKPGEFVANAETVAVAVGDAPRLVAALREAWAKALECPACEKLAHNIARAEAAEADCGRLRDVLDEIAKNAEGYRDGGLPHFSKRDFSDAVAFRARAALAKPGGGA